MYKWLQWIVVFSLVLSGCLAQQATPPDNSISFSFPSQDEAYYRSLVNTFYAQNAGITVRLEPVPTSQLDEQTGDVQVITWDIAGDHSAWSANKYLDLQTFIANDESFNPADIYAGAWVPFTAGSTAAGIPYGMDLDMLFYNRSIFDSKQAAYPTSDWNWDTFLGAAARLTNRAQNIYGYAPLEGYADSLYFLYQNGGSLLDSEGQARLDSDRNIEALGWYSRLFTTLNVAPTVRQAQQNFGYAEDVFALGVSSGKVGMWTAPYSNRAGSGSTGKTQAFEYGIAALPHGQANATSGQLEAYAITKNAKNKEACWKLIAFLSTQPHPRLIPARISVTSSLGYAQAVGAEAAAAGRVSAEHLIAIPDDQASEMAKARQAFLKAVAQAVGLNATSRQALEAAQKSLIP